MEISDIKSGMMNCISFLYTYIYCHYAAWDSSSPNLITRKMLITICWGKITYSFKSLFSHPSIVLVHRHHLSRFWFLSRNFFHSSSSCDGIKIVFIKKDEEIEVLRGRFVYFKKHSKKKVHCCCSANRLNCIWLENFILISFAHSRHSESFHSLQTLDDAGGREKSCWMSFRDEIKGDWMGEWWSAFGSCN